MAEWFIHHDEETEIGPLQPSELKELVRTGAITEETLCRKDDSAWFRACDIDGLFATADSQVLGYRCPSCKNSVGKPPTYCKNCEKYLDEATEILQTGKTAGNGGPSVDAPPEKSNSWMSWLSRLKS